MTTPATFVQAVQEWNNAHTKEPIKLNGYHSTQDMRVAGIGRTIFAYYNKEKGWKFEHVGCGWSPLACIILVLRQCCIFRMLSGYDETVLPFAQKIEMRNHLISGQPIVPSADQSSDSKHSKQA